MTPRKPKEPVSNAIKLATKLSPEEIKEAMLFIKDNLKFAGETKLPNALQISKTELTQKVGEIQIFLNQVLAMPEAKQEVVRQVMVLPRQDITTFFYILIDYLKGIAEDSPIELKGISRSRVKGQQNYIEYKMIKRKGKEYGPYRYWRYYANGVYHSVYLKPGKTVSGSKIIDIEDLEDQVRSLLEKDEKE